MQYLDSPEQNSFVPALGKAWLTPLYDFTISILTRERIWREALAKQISPMPGENIIDIGCGTGSLVLLLKNLEPSARITGIDPDEAVLAIAMDKTAKQKSDIRFINNFFNLSLFSPDRKFDKITSSLVLHQVPLKEKLRILQTAFTLTRSGGSIHIADFGLQRTRLMRGLFHLVQRLDGYEYTTPNAEGVVPGLMEEAGFTGVTEEQVIPTSTGSISIYFGRKL
jgi:ubiquinone/menaquinone biosynthesis C-methylase UbiE